MNLSSYEKLLKEIKETCPDSEIYLESLLPTNSVIAIAAPSLVIRIFNESMQQFSKKYDAEYIELHSSFLSGDYIKSSFTCDGLHLTDEGYQVWYDIVADYL